MKTTTHTLITLLFSLVPVLLVAGIAEAQQPKAAYEHPNTRLDVDFPGGTLQAFVDAIRKARPTGAANVVVMPEAKSLKVPPVNLVAVTVDAAIHILEGPYTLADGRRAYVTVQSYEMGDTPDLVLKVTAEFERSSIRSSVWNVEPALAAGQSAEELLGAVEAVLSLFSQKADISFHPPTRLLIARGADEQLDLVHETIEQLIGSAARRQEEFESILFQTQAFEEELSTVRGSIQVALQTVELARTRFESAVNLRERGEAPADVAAEARLEITRAETELEVLKTRQQRIETNLKRALEARKKWERPRE